MYNVFTRPWWKENDKWPNGLEPEPNGDRKYLAKWLTLSEAKELAKAYNEENDPGRLSIKAEIEEA